MKSSIPQVRLVKPEFPRYQRGQIAAFVIGTLLWIGLIFLFVFSLYVSWFQLSFANILQFLIKQKKSVPFWFGALLTIFVFPVTLGVVLVDGLRKILQK
jgi:hypothetical protein